MTRLAFCITLLAMMGCSRRPPAEASTNIDLQDLGPLLQRVSSLIDSGFGETERARILTLVKGMDHDDQREADFTVTFRGAKMALLVALKADDPESFEIFFFTQPALAEAILTEMKRPK